MTTFSCAAALGRTETLTSAESANTLTHRVIHPPLPPFGCLARCGLLTRSPLPWCLSASTFTTSQQPGAWTSHQPTSVLSSPRVDCCLRIADCRQVTGLPLS